jgi:hypothetical protein
MFFIGEGQLTHAHGASQIEFHSVPFCYFTNSAQQTVKTALTFP